mmetsp:Transcript_32927/g.79666  ORF Transcript_32927/g.79666 Transcript_32927/m.79666 type:complete len:323 (+) Transcript_32927:296-1264(+)
MIRSMIALGQNEMSPLPEPVQVLESHLLDRCGLHSQILHREYLIVVRRLRRIPLGRHRRQVILAEQIDHIRREHRASLVLHHVGAVLDDLPRHVRQRGILPGDVVHEARELRVGIILGSEAVDATALELLGIIDDTVDRTRDVVHPHRLGESVSPVHEGYHGEAIGHVREPVEEAVLVAEQLRGTYDRGPGIRLEDLLLALVLGPRPLGRRVGAGRRAAHVDEIVHLQLGAKFGDGFGNPDVGLRHRGGYLVFQEGELARVLEGLGVVVLPHHVDDHIGVRDEIGHGLLVAAGVEGEFCPAELVVRAEVTVGEFVLAGTNIG